MVVDINGDCDLVISNLTTTHTKVSDFYIYVQCEKKKKNVNILLPCITNKNKGEAS